ncbi:extracellular solute-binding protein [Thalassovita taeanensis]|uniref:Putrescine-binding periplasmic protein n=1 Tax=Thalassovita taeanensis TaxID=657014 RepID=A0A1H9D6Y9_9RHOB|nr:extracellular solute-binding protein [Thalassovita taeanensis]SEQ09149.1 spermidine/putrescine transport system substrate-binding protein [Thalassovita taeanensis]
MKKLLTSVAALATVASMASAEGELNIFNWGNYTNPDLIKKFEETYDVKVTVTDFDSNTTALTKIEAGGHGFDIVVPTHSYIPIYVEKGLLMKPGIPEMENYHNLAPQWVDVDWDPKREYSVPWQWGTTGVAVNTKAYSGDVNTAAIFMDPPAELVGKVNVVPEMQDVISMALMYVGGTPCTTDKTMLKAARDALVAAKPKWMSMDYGMTEKMSNGDVMASVNWNGSTFRIRNNNPDVVYGYPKEGYIVWMDNAAILNDAKNADNAKLFINFIMDPENAAMISSFARYANGITGSEAFMPDDMKTAPEIVVPADLVAAGKFTGACPKEAQDMYTAIWTELQK